MANKINRSDRRLSGRPSNLLHLLSQPLRLMSMALLPSRLAAFRLDGGWASDNCIVYVTSPNRVDQLGHQLAMRLRAAHAHLRRRSNLAFSPFGMTADQYVLLSVLAQSGGATQQELVRQCSSDTATMGAMLLLLETKGLVTRTPHPEDGRAVRVQLTRTGRCLAEAMRRGSASLRAELVALFQEPERALLMEFLDRLAGAMRPPGRKAAASRSRRLKPRPH
jgi:MarR family transcriptional regulator, organic hydroperoxide resistance regulator